jgi:protein dithiol:quinone oxidoreductase
LIASRGQRRVSNAAGFGICAALMGYALYAQYVLKLEPCPLCTFQRGAMILLGIVFAVAAAGAPRALGARVLAVLGALAAVTGLGISSWHVHIQNLPPEEVPACGPGLDYMMSAFPFREMISMVFTGSGECHEINWSFAGLSMPFWTGIWFVILGVLVVAANWSRLSR